MWVLVITLWVGVVLLALIHGYNLLEDRVWQRDTRNYQQELDLCEFDELDGKKVMTLPAMPTYPTFRQVVTELKWVMREQYWKWRYRRMLNNIGG